MTFILLHVKMKSLATGSLQGLHYMRGAWSVALPKSLAILFVLPIPIMDSPSCFHEMACVSNATKRKSLLTQLEIRNKNDVSNAPRSFSSSSLWIKIPHIYSF